MAVKVIKGQIRSGTISKIKCHKEYCLCGIVGQHSQKIRHSVLFVKKYETFHINNSIPYDILFLIYIVWLQI